MASPTPPHNVNSRPAVEYTDPAPPYPVMTPSWSATTLLDPRNHAFASPGSTPPHAMSSPSLPSLAGSAYRGNSEVPALAFQNGVTSHPPPPAFGNGIAADSHAVDVSFQFMGASTGTYIAQSSPGDAYSPDATNGTPLQMKSMDRDLQGSGDDAGVTLVAPPSGVASMIERGFHLQDRHDVPDPKRRKTIPTRPAWPSSSFQSSSNGVLSKAVKDEEAKAEDDVSDAPVIVAARPVTVDLTDGAESNGRGKGSYEEVCFGSVLGVTVDCHRVPAPKPGSQAMGGPAYFPTVKIVLRRKVGDRTHTIDVYDHTREVFGSLDRRSSDCLAPLLDISKVHLRTDAKIPSRRKNDEVIGQPISRSYKIDLVLYGAATFSKAVGKHLFKKGFKIVKPNHYDAKVRLAVPVQTSQPGMDGALAGQSTTERPTAASPIASGSPFPTLTGPLRTSEEIRSEALSVFDSMANAEDLPEMDPDSSVTTPMLRHQKQALYFMTNREKTLAEQTGTMLTSSIWQRKTMSTTNQTFYYNVITRQNESQPPRDTLGGILADMMGLGKTLSILSLVTSTKALAEEWRVSRPVQPKAPEKKKKPGAPLNFDAPVPQTLDLTKLKCNGRGTLLVCPLSTVTNWEEQIKQHLVPDSLNYHVYHGQNRIKDVERLSEFDLVITTYGSVSSELTARSRGKTGQHPLEEVGWFRVVLDEAHMIREPATLQFKAICRLQASRRWAVTGTPVQNRLEDLGSLLAFLRLQPFDDRAKFNQFILTPFRACDPNILTQLRILVDTITLRRLKDKIDLPPRTDVIVRLDFSHEEGQLYSFYNRNAKDRLQVLAGRNERLLGGKTYIHILQSILRLRLICAHGRELLNDDDLRLMQGSTLESAIDLDEDDDALGGTRQPLTENRAYDIFDLLINTNADKCVSCERKLGADDEMSGDIRSEKQEDILGYMTPCFHLYCPNCVKKFADASLGLTYKSNQIGTCPSCSKSVVFTCAELRHDRADTEHDAQPNRPNDTGKGSRDGNRNAGGAAAASGKTLNGDNYSGPHTKTKALLQELLQNKAESLAHPDQPPIKSVVFSGWTSHLDLIQRALSDVGISYCRLDGKMSRLARTQAMDTFRDNPDVHIILVSIMAGGLGLNLTAGNHVYVMEPQYNPAAEAQAVDRVHRLGQKRPVRTVRYIMRNSFEEHMLEIQNKKIELANLSMNRSDRAISSGEAARQRLQELRSLFK